MYSPLEEEAGSDRESGLPRRSISPRLEDLRIGENIDPTMERSNGVMGGSSSSDNSPFDSPELDRRDRNRKPGSEHLRLIPSAHATERRRNGTMSESDKSGPIESLSQLACWKSTNARGRMILLSLFLVQLTDVMCISVMAPFFPKEGELKGLSTQTIGWIFSVFPLVRFVFSPLLGKMLPYMGCRNMIMAGQICTGVFFISFGVLDFIETKDSPSSEINQTSLALYTALCFTFRMLTAAGSAASGTAVFTIVSMEFKDDLAQRYGILQSAVGLGLVLGPAIGGLLYASGGYVVPFGVLGCTIMLTIPLCLVAIPKHELTEKHTSLDCESMSEFLRKAPVIVMGLSIFVAAIIWSSLEPTLEPHLRTFKLSPALLGLVYFMIGAFYILACPVVGCIIDKKPHLILLMMIIGFVFSCLCLLLIGPSPILGPVAEENLFWLNLLALGLFGVVASFAVVPSYNKILISVGATYNELSFAMNSFIAGYYNSCWSFGEFIGPLWGAALTEFWGFGWANTCTGALCILLTFVLFILYIYERAQVAIIARKTYPATNGTSCVADDSMISSSAIMATVAVEDDYEPMRQHKNNNSKTK